MKPSSFVIFQWGGGVWTPCLLPSLDPRMVSLNTPVHETLVLIVYVYSEGSDTPAYLSSLAREFVPCKHKLGLWMKAQSKL